MGAVVIELLFKVIHIEALAEGTGDPFVVFCAFKEAGHAADALQDGALLPDSIAYHRIPYIPGEVRSGKPVQQNLCRPMRLKESKNSRPGLRE
ncbi:MAG: hypothetical protein QM305_02465 [Bacteroidota bacterium]|nr:hypothetical protein [Bacteroidota bacterium]